MPDFKLVRKGYDTFEVNRYIEKLQKEIDSFKEQEAYINRAIISAEAAASDIKDKAAKECEEITAKAKADAEKVLTDANNEAEKLLSKAHNQLELIRRREKDKLDDVKLFIQDQLEYLARFKEDYDSLVKKYFEVYPNGKEYDKIIESLNNISSLIDNLENTEK